MNIIAKEMQIYPVKGKNGFEMHMISDEDRVYEFRFLCFDLANDGVFFALNLENNTIVKASSSSYYDNITNRTETYFNYSEVKFEEFKNHVRGYSERCYERIKDLSSTDTETLKSIIFGNIYSGRDIFIKQYIGNEVMLLSVSYIYKSYIVRYASVDKEVFQRHFGNFKYLGDVFEDFADENSPFREEINNEFFSVNLSPNQLLRTTPLNKKVTILKDTVTKFTRWNYCNEKEEETNLTECLHNLASFVRYLKNQHDSNKDSDECIYVESKWEYIKQMAILLKDSLKKGNREKFVPDYIPVGQILDVVPAKNGAWAYEGFEEAVPSLKRLLLSDKKGCFISLLRILMFLLGIISIILAFWQFLDNLLSGGAASIPDFK